MLEKVILMDGLKSQRKYRANGFFGYFTLFRMILFAVLILSWRLL
jgi:hypothetical protein